MREGEFCPSLVPTKFLDVGTNRVNTIFADICFCFFTNKDDGARCMLPELYLCLKASYCSVYILPLKTI